MPTCFQEGAGGPCHWFTTVIMNRTAGSLLLHSKGPVLLQKNTGRD